MNERVMQEHGYNSIEDAKSGIEHGLAPERLETAKVYTFARGLAKATPFAPVPVASRREDK